MNILEVQEENKKMVKRLSKELRHIKRELNKCSTSYCELAAKSIEEEYGFPCRIESYKTCIDNRLVLYAKNSTRKQVQYKREEKQIGSIRVYPDKIQLIACPDVYTELPRTTDELFKILINMGKVVKKLRELYPSVFHPATTIHLDDIIEFIERGELKLHEDKI